MLIHVATLAAVLIAPCHAGPADPITARQVAPATELGVPFDRYEVLDSLGRTVTFYLSPAPADSRPRPVVLWIQGSGGTSLFTAWPDGRTGGGLQMFVLRAGAGRFRVLAVEKPGVAFLDNPEPPGSAEGCSREFLAEHTPERWTSALVGALRATLAMDGIDRARVLAAGHSEGADMATHVAAAMPEVTHVALLSGGGPTQLFDMAEMARRARSHDEAEPVRERRVEEVYAQFARIRADPESIDEFAWGHPYRRWSGFFARPPMDSLRATTARIYLAYGTADESVPVESNDVLRAELARLGRDATVERRIGEDHGFRGPGDKTWSGMQAVIANVAGWFMGAP